MVSFLSQTRNCHADKGVIQAPTESTSPYDPNRYLSDPDLEELFKGEFAEDTIRLNQYYDALEPPGQDGLAGRYSVLVQDSFYFLIPAATVLGALYLMPESVSKWEKDEIVWNEAKEKWKENVTSWTWDGDDRWINYIGHPYFGSSYFIYARHYGYSRLESFFYSMAISTFYEVLLEAWAEPVSIQDMIFTPLGGWLVAEILLPIEFQIKKNDGKVLGSTVLGSTSLFLIAPFDHVVPPIKGWMDNLFSSDTTVSLQPVFSKNSRFARDSMQSVKEERMGLKLTVKW